MSTHYPGTTEETRALDAYIKLLRAADAVSARTNGAMVKAGLTPSQFGVMEALWHLGAMSQSALGKKLLRSNANITTVVDNLEKRGLVVRQRDTEDRRVVIVHLTPEGKQCIKTIFPGHVADIVREMGQLSPKEQETLAQLCRKVGVGLSI